MYTVTPNVPEDVLKRIPWFHKVTKDVLNSVPGLLR